MMVISSKDEGGETVEKEDYSFANKMMVRPQQKNVNKNTQGHKFLRRDRRL